MRNTLGSGWAVAALFVYGMATAGCFTRSKDFQLSKIGRGDTAIAGRLTVIYNGQVFTENCFATFDGRRLRLTSDGIVLLVVPANTSGLHKLECLDTSLQHVTINDVRFVAHPDVVNDFGDVVVTWEVLGGVKVSSLFGFVGGLVDEVFDDGVATSVVRPPIAEVREAFKRQTGVAGVWSVPLVPIVARPAKPTVELLR